MIKLKAEEKTKRIAEIKKLIKAGIILDLRVRDLAQPADSRTGNLDKFKATAWLNKSKSTNIDYWYDFRSEHWVVRDSYDYSASQYRMIGGYDSLYITRKCTSKAVAYIKKNNLDEGVGDIRSASTTEVSSYTDEDVDWAKSVFRNIDIDLSGIHIEGIAVEIRYRKTVEMEIVETVFVEKLQDAVDIQDAVRSGKIKRDFKLSDLRHIDANVNTSTLRAGPVTIK